MTLTLVACATAQDPEVDTGPGTGNVPATGGSSGGSGGNAATGGSGGSLPIAGTTTFPTAGTGTGTAGTPSSGGSGSGGAASGGTSSMPTAGTSSSGTCPTPYAGTLAKDSTIFTAGYGQSTTGMWKGYGFTFKYGTATITPGSGTGCFEAKKFCASGSVPAADTAGAGLGWNLGQAQGATATTAVPIKTAVTISFAGLPAGSRVQLSASATVQYCYTLAATETTSATIPYASFKKDCWDTATAVAYDGVTPIEAIQVVVPGAMAAAKTFDFCVTDVEPG